MLADDTESPMKRTPVIAAVVAVALAYTVGCWPQYRQRTEVQSQLQDTQTRLSAAEGRLRLADLLGHLLRLSDAVAVKNYGEAATLSSAFFDAVRAEASRADRSDVTTVLQSVLTTRDPVTTAIAGSDPALPSMLKVQERALRRALGYPVVGGS